MALDLPLFARKGKAKDAGGGNWAGQMRHGPLPMPFI